MAKVETGNMAHLISMDQVLPPRLYVIPMKARPVFPGIVMPLIIADEKHIKTVEKAQEADGFVGMLLADNPEAEEDEEDNFYRIGTIGKILKKINLPDGKINIFVNTIRRFRAKKFLSFDPFITAAVEYIEEAYDRGDDELKAMVRTLYTEIKEVSENNPFFTEEIKLNMANLDGAEKVADFVSSILNIEREQQQEILEILNVKERIERVLTLLHREKELLKLQKKIQESINEKVTQQQREYFLREQLKAIKQELGMEVDAKNQDYKRFKERLDTLDLDGEVKEKVYDELDKFGLMDSRSPEFTITRNYLETVTTLPWDTQSETGIDIKRARKILDQDHYDLDEVKERILEFLSVKKLNPESKGSILCLVGPPGVGKTSVGKSVARAMGRKFFRFSLGGMRDEAEIKGHRRTYIGAMPGKIIQALRIVGVRNPVIMLDEIDKLGVSFQGDPSSALLEVLDPEQNVEFRDHYVDLPFDLSQVMFITTGNTLDTIPSPLLDRMEVIRLSGYIEEEKIEIARRYIIPRSLERNGLHKSDVKFAKDSLREILRGYVREAGLRNFEKAIDKINRKIARRMLEEELALPITVRREHLREYLGERAFPEEGRRRIDRPGLAVGLAWTPLGGETLTVESNLIPGKGSFKLTGSLGEVMQESANIALSYVRSVAPQFGVDPSLFNKNMIHLHVPAGATRKDGPSAGITMAVAMFSLVTGKKVKNRLAMTGEISLIGNVLPVGGIKEKLIAAKRAGIREIVLPAENQKDLNELPGHITKGITFRLASTMEEVLGYVFPDVQVGEVKPPGSIPAREQSVAAGR